MFGKRYLTLAALVLSLGLAACGKENGEGPAERAGKQVDKAVEQAGQTMEKAAESVKQGAQDLADKAKEASK